MPAINRLARLASLVIAGVVALSVGSLTLAQDPSATPGAAQQRAAVAPEGSWAVERYDPSGTGLVEPLPNVPFRLDFLIDGRLEGEAGCGTLFGGYFVDGDELRMDILNKGLDPCGARRIEAGIELATAVEQVRTWRPAGEGLELLDETGLVRVILAPVAVVTPQGDWVVERVARANGRLFDAAVDNPATMTLAADGTFTGSTGCRRFDGDWIADAGRITVVTVDLDGLPCEGDAARVERRLLRSLELVTDWERRDGLILTDASGSPLVTLRSAELALASPAPTSPAPTSPAPSPAPAAADTTDGA